MATVPPATTTEAGPSAVSSATVPAVQKFAARTLYSRTACAVLSARSFCTGSLPAYDFVSASVAVGSCT
jgi:hypothetical protein